MRRVYKNLHVWTAKHLMMSLGITTFSKLKPQMPLPASVPTNTIPTARVISHTKRFIERANKQLDIDHVHPLNGPQKANSWMLLMSIL